MRQNTTAEIERLREIDAERGKRDDSPNKEDSVNKDKEDRRQTRDPYPEGALKWSFSVHQASYNQLFVPIFHKNPKMAGTGGSVPAQATDFSYEGDNKNVIAESLEVVPEAAPEKA
ncbi:hypothetical protein WN944_003964 [Citrus x changshan-huyou]|uniref:Uncharacterized protein n=1 Tax=Citrus x changshan-huyou TaxID=2935761 RepID=A0AAP0M2D8_9ROSI